jgi:predicted NBD/HSP70 family sugar kinase
MLIGPNSKRLRKDSRIERLQSQLGIMTHIAREYEKTLIELAKYADRFAHGPNKAKEVLQRINKQLTGGR